MDPTQQTPISGAVDPTAILAALAAVGGGAPGNTAPVPPGQGVPAPAPVPGPPAGAVPVDPYGPPKLADVTHPEQGFAGAQPFPDSAATPGPNPVAAPVNPYTPGTELQGGNPPDPYGVNQTRKGMESAIATEGQDQENAALAANQAKRDTLAARSANLQATAQAQSNEAALKIQADQAANNAADAQTARWMQEVQEKSAQEPNPHRWWDNTSGFGKVMWALSLAFGAKAAASAPGVQNVALKMMDQAIDEDIQSQRERQARELAALQTKGTLISQKRARDLALDQDVYTARVSRLNTISQAIDLRLQAPNSEDDKAALLQAKAAVDGKKTQVAEAYWQNAQATQRQALTQAAEDARSKRQIAAQLTISANDNATRLATAEIEAGARASAAKGAAAGNVLPIGGSDITVQRADGTTEQVAVPKDAMANVSQAVDAAQQKKTALANLEKAILDTTRFGRMANDENEFRAALAQAADPQVRQMHGRLSKETADTVAEMLVGQDSHSWWQSLKGADTQKLADIVHRQYEMVDQQLGDSLTHLPGAVGATTGQPFGPKDTVVANLKSQEPPAPKDEGVDDTIAQETGAAGAVPRPATPDDFHKDLTTGVLKNPTDRLDPDLRAIIREHGTAFALGERDVDSPDNIRRAAEKALSEIHDWEVKNPGRDAEAKDAENRVTTLEQDATKVSVDKMGTLLDRLDTQHNGGTDDSDGHAIYYPENIPLTAKDVNTQAAKIGIKLDTAEINRILTEINSRGQSYYRRPAPQAATIDIPVTE